MGCVKESIWHEKGSHMLDVSYDSTDLMFLMILY